MTDGDTPTPSSAPLPSSVNAGSGDPEEAEEEEVEKEIDEEDAKPRPSGPSFKISTFVYTFLMLIGVLMLFSPSTRTQVSLGFDYLLSPSIGFHGHYPLLTMFLAGAIEMALTAIAYNLTTDWVKAAKVGKWGAAIRKAQMAAMKSGKKDRIEALKEHQATLARLQFEVTIAQLKSLAATWFLLLAVYNWVYLFLEGGSGTIANAWVGTGASCPAAFYTATAAVHTTGGFPAQACVAITGWNVPLLSGVAGISFLPVWFLLFSLFTIPLSFLFRRVLKDWALRSYRAKMPPASAITEIS
jgi:uncharacterized membrane protein (DUF106 family)